MTHDKWVFVGCVVDNYFLQVATTLSFHAFFFLRTKASNFDEVQFIDCYKIQNLSPTALPGKFLFFPKMFSFVLLCVVTHGSF